MDFIVGLPKLGNKSFIMVVVDRLSKYAHFFFSSVPIHNLHSGSIFLDNIFKLHGMPHSIVSNRDPTFSNNLWKELFRLYRTQLHLITTYHPQTDGQTEAVNKCLETYLRCFVLNEKIQWVQWLPLIEFWCNTSYHISTHMTPFEALYRQRPSSIIAYMSGVSNFLEVDHAI
jgi:hypothetical protein